jgi:alcohol dehydrogenase
VSQIDPDHAGRWDKDRRLDTVCDMLADVDPDNILTDEYPVEQAERAYDQLASSPESTAGVVLTYE